MMSRITCKAGCCDSFLTTVNLFTAVNLGTLEMTLLYDSMAGALHCSLHRAKVSSNLKSIIDFTFYTRCLEILITNF